MKRICQVVLLTFLVLALPLEFTALAMISGENEQTLGNESYAFEIQKKSDETMRVQFIGNQMFHDSKYLGFGVNGKPMLSLRYIAERFGFKVDYDLKAETCLLTKGEYSFQLKPGSNFAEIYWAGEKVNEIELTEKPMVRNNVFYLYSLDISDLFGLISRWDSQTKTWDVIYRDYTYQEIGFPKAINGDLLKIKGLLFDADTFTMPMLQITDTTNTVHSYFSSISSIESDIDSCNKYEMSTEIQLLEKITPLQVRISMGQRIIFSKSIEIEVNLEAKELLVNLPYQITSPTQGYVKITEPQMLISGSFAGLNNYCPSEVALFVRKADNGEILLKENVPIIDGQFKHKLELINGEGLYKVTVNSIMAAPHGLAYPEITNFYVEYQ